MICSITSLNVLVLLSRFSIFNCLYRTFSKIYIWMQERVIVYLDRFRWCHLQHHKYKLIWIQKKSRDKISKNFSNSTIIITGWYYYIGVSLLIYRFQNVIKCIHHKRTGAYKLSRLLYVILHEMQNIVLSSSCFIRK